MEIDKNIEIAIKHIYSYFHDNNYDELQALLTMAVVSTMVLKSGYERSKKTELKNIFKDYKDRL